MKNFDVSDWYWSIGGDTQSVYSSKRNALVPVTDTAFRTWCADGSAPRSILNEAELWDVLRQRGIALPDWMLDGGKFISAAGNYSKGQLIAYAAGIRYEKEVGGMSFNGLPIATDRQSQAMINGAFNLAQVNPSLTVQFKTDQGFASIDAAQIKALAVAVATHVQACFSAEAGVEAAIAAGTVTDLAGIDTAFAGLG